MPFSIQRIQTDRGTEFFAEGVQRRLMAECIKFRPIPPRSPHLNGRVERSQLTDLTEFWARHSPKEEGIHERIEEWQFVYNYRRSHGGLGGKTPAGRIADVGDRTPLSPRTTNRRNESGLAIGRKTELWQLYTNPLHLRLLRTTAWLCRPHKN